MALSLIVTGTAWKWLLDPGVGLEQSLHSLGWESFSFGWIKSNEMAIYCGRHLRGVGKPTGFCDGNVPRRATRRRTTNRSMLRASDGAKTWQIYLRHHHPAARAGVRFRLCDPRAHGDQELRPRRGAYQWRTWPFDLAAVRVHCTSTRSRAIEMAVGAASSVLMLVAIGVIVLPYLLSEMRKVKMANATTVSCGTAYSRRRGSRENIRCWPDRSVCAARSPWPSCF